MSRRNIAIDGPRSQVTALQRPMPLPMVAENIPEDLKVRPQWVGWQYEADARRQKWVKRPYDPGTQQPASITDASTWGTYKEALAAATAQSWDGIGFAFTALDGLVGVDIDNCRDPKNGELARWAVTIIERLASYTEISPSGTGIKIFLKGTLPQGGRRRGNIEVYDRGRYFDSQPGDTLRGHRLLLRCGRTPSMPCSPRSLNRWR